jgi:N-acetylneuraminate synthase/N,N'-diacetyllegionaminate synthase
MSISINIHGRVVGPDQPCFIIAEAGVNHGGDLQKAITMVDAAAGAGAFWLCNFRRRWNQDHRPVGLG